jgi:hypothetical protein
MSDNTPETTHLGHFDPLEAPIVLDLLHEHGIFAFSKTPLGQNEALPYGGIFGDSGRGRIFVDTAQLAEAQRIVRDELPERLAEMQRALEEGFAVQEELAESGEPYPPDESSPPSSSSSEEQPGER